MIRLLEFLFTGDWHLHKWEIIKETRVTEDGYSHEPTRYSRFYCQCSVCGKIKIFD